MSSSSPASSPAGAAVRAQAQPELSGKEVDQLKRQIEQLQTENLQLKGRSLESLSLDDLKTLRNTVKVAEERISNAITHMQMQELLKEKMKAAMSLQTSTIAKECTICLDAEANICLHPCGHVCMCTGCAGPQNMCPICRMPIEKKTPIFFAS
eukprot:comp6374_c0_seq1/m.6148 comp6374_c0_seq1/g.6148  ORF comp6374_c0_seq1/g.6148 comp6374_c0_seq1/m.6148 type:complete len:153 (+) comp6374_c0_seq1:2-460(+)